MGDTNKLRGNIMMIIWMIIWMDEVMHSRGKQLSFHSLNRMNHI